MKRYAPYIITILVAILLTAAVFHKFFGQGARNVKYGNPAYERLVRECRYYKTGDECLVVKLYEGRNSAKGTSWYSVTVEEPGIDETQIFISSGNPGVDSIGLCEKEIKLMCGKGCVTIPIDELDSRVKIPLIYYNGEEMRDGEVLSNKI